MASRGNYEQEPSLRFSYRPTRRGRLVIDSYQPSLLYDSEKDRQLDQWWRRDVAISFNNEAQAWMAYEGANIAMNAGMDVEIGSHEMAQNETAGQLIEILAGSNGHHFEVEKIMERAKRHVRELEIQNRSVAGFLVEFVDLMAEARGLSSKHKTQLRASILQSKLQI